MRNEYDEIIELENAASGDDALEDARHDNDSIWVSHAFRIEEEDDEELEEVQNSKKRFFSIDHPLTDSNIDYAEVYDMGLAAAANADFATDSYSVAYKIAS